VSGLSGDEVVAVRRAGLLHDLGRLGVPNTVWDRAGPLPPAAFERVRLHPYLTDRMLAPVATLGRVREIASRHHERLDGSGYPRGLTAATLTPSDRLLAAADVYYAMTEPRPHRGPLDPDGLPANCAHRPRPAGWTARRCKRCCRPRATARPRGANGPPG
jgi:HD-GYP domain-containing protein (c-di-GMP phosphodiesterase class II)